MQTILTKTKETSLFPLREREKRVRSNADINGIALHLDKYKKSWKQVSASDLSLIEDISLQEDREGIHAKLILEFVEDILYEEPIIDDEEEELKAANNIFTQPSINEAIRIIPNPVSESSFVFIIIEEEQKGLTNFYISDIRGRVVKTYLLYEAENVIELNHKILEPGFYIGYLDCTACSNSNKSFIVIK